MENKTADIKSTVSDAIRKANKEKGKISDIIEDIKTLGRMLKAYANENNFEMPKAVMIAAVATLAYFINPFDVIPDFIAGAGFIDDAAVLTLMLNSFSKDIKRFRKWELTNAEPAEVIA